MKTFFRGSYLNHLRQLSELLFPVSFFSFFILTLSDKCLNDLSPICVSRVHGDQAMGHGCMGFAQS
jgi:hypothetical protein